jgi:methyl-accepting chemotaxis protein
MATGDLNVRVIIKSKDAIGEMAASFAQMVSAQQSSRRLTAVSWGILSRKSRFHLMRTRLDMRFRHGEALKDVMQRNENNMPGQSSGDLDARTI